MIWIVIGIGITVMTLCFWLCVFKGGHDEGDE